MASDRLIRDDSESYRNLVVLNRSYKYEAIDFKAYSRKDMLIKNIIRN